MNTHEIEPGKATVVVGLQYGDEGKGKIVDLLAKDADAVARGNGGANAGHTIVANGQKATLHQVPSGIVHPGKLNVMGHGVLLDPVKLVEEIDELSNLGIEISPENLAIAGMAHMVTPKHKIMDEIRESGANGQGSTKSGIAFAAADASLREGIRFDSTGSMSHKELFDSIYWDLRRPDRSGSSLKLGTALSIKAANDQAKLFADSAMSLKDYAQDTTGLLQGIINRGGNVLIEGAQAYGLDKNHGKYPNCTSSGTIVPSLIEGTGLNDKQIGRRVGIAKATMSKVGGGSFVTREDDPEIAQAIRGRQGEIDAEYGGTTGREREVGHLDLVMLKRAVQVNGIDEIALTKFDCIRRVGPLAKLATAYQRPIPESRFETETIDVPPNSDAELAKCKPVYMNMLTWDDNKSPAAQNYLQFIEDHLGVPVSIVSTGPGRNSIIKR